MIYGFAATRSLRTSLDDSINQKKSEFYYMSQRESAQRDRNDDDNDFCRMSNSLYIPQSLSASISISINSRRNIHSQNQVRRRKNTQNPNNNSFQSQKVKNDIIKDINKNRPQNLRTSGGFETSHYELESFRKENFGLKTANSIFSGNKRRLSFRKASVKPIRLEDNELHYNFEFNKYTPTQITLKDYLDKIQPDIVPNLSPTIHNRTFHFKKPKTANSSSQRSPKGKELDKPKEMILSHKIKPSTAQTYSSFGFRETSNERKTAIWKMFSFDEENNNTPASNIESLDQRCITQLKDMGKKNRFKDFERSYGTKNKHVNRLNESLQNGEKIRQEMYSDIERYKKRVMVKMREDKKIQPRAFTPQSIRVYKI